MNLPEFNCEFYLPHSSKEAKILRLEIIEKEKICDASAEKKLHLAFQAFLSSLSPPPSRWEWGNMLGYWIEVTMLCAPLWNLILGPKQKFVKPLFIFSSFCETCGKCWRTLREGKIFLRNFHRRHIFFLLLLSGLKMCILWCSLWQRVEGARSLCFIVLHYV